MPHKKQILSTEQRFELTSDDELEKMRQKIANPNTKKANNKAEKAFTNWLQARKYDEQFWLLDEPTLDNYLSKFWFEACTQEGEMYCTSSLENI